MIDMNVSACLPSWPWRPAWWVSILMQLRLNARRRALMVSKGQERCARRHRLGGRDVCLRMWRRLPRRRRLRRAAAMRCVLHRRLCVGRHRRDGSRALACVGRRRDFLDWFVCLLAGEWTTSACERRGPRAKSVHGAEQDKRTTLVTRPLASYLFGFAAPSLLWFGRHLRRFGCSADVGSLRV
jgi:hypothetical protein